MSVMFDFNASLNDFAPVSLMSFSVDVKRVDEVIADGYLLLCLLSSVFTLEIERSECCVRFQCLTQ